MFVYSNKILNFIQEVKFLIKEVLSKEIKVKVFGDRFFDREQRYSYPISVVIYNNKSVLGYFDPHFFELGFHECLIGSTHLVNIIRHELAHYMTFIAHGPEIICHGSLFHDFCRQMNWNEEVSRASICLESKCELPNKEEHQILRKVRKIMALSSSSNPHEAEVAIMKSRQLLLTHNIEMQSFIEENEERIFIKRIMQQKREDAKMRAISKILETFFVNVVYRKGTGFICLEIIGEAVNIEIAEYVADVLQKDFETLWVQAKKMAQLKGMIAKNSFFLGIAKGYCEKIGVLKKEYSAATTHSLIALENKLKIAKEKIYPRLSTSKSSGYFCQKSSELGQQVGRELQIQPALKPDSREIRGLLT